MAFLNHFWYAFGTLHFAFDTFLTPLKTLFLGLLESVNESKRKSTSRLAKPQVYILEAKLQPSMPESQKKM